MSIEQQEGDIGINIDDLGEGVVANESGLPPEFEGGFDAVSSDEIIRDLASSPELLGRIAQAQNAETPYFSE